MDWKALFISYEGRIGRKAFWIGFLILFAAGIVLGFIPFVGILLLWPWCAIYAKRLHDMGRTGWLLLVPVGVWIVCMILGMMMGGMAVLGAMGGYSDAAAAGSAFAGASALAAFLGIAFLVNLAFLVWVGATPGQPGENQYGLPPVDGGTGSTVVAP